jgi:hypothetical protein
MKMEAAYSSETSVSTPKVYTIITQNSTILKLLAIVTSNLILSSILRTFLFYSLQGPPFSSLLIPLSFSIANCKAAHFEIYPTFLLPRKSQYFRQRHYTTSRKVAGSIPHEVIGFFNRPNHIRTMALESTQPVTEMSTRNLPGG